MPDLKGKTICSFIDFSTRQHESSAKPGARGDKQDERTQNQQPIVDEDGIAVADPVGQEAQAKLAPDAERDGQGVARHGIASLESHIGEVEHHVFEQGQEIEEEAEEGAEIIPFPQPEEEEED